MGDSYRHELKKHKEKSGHSRTTGDKKAAYKRSQAIKREQSREALYLGKAQAARTAWKAKQGRLLDD